ncbi:hypothetical protein [Stutzerimonas stutzeri]|uniref:hypothetical protein n=1 Tax=Stutzerimonas stutzeri TaxID=316 RepID=UPI003C7046C0
MLTLVGAGYGDGYGYGYGYGFAIAIAIAIASQVQTLQRPDISIPPGRHPTDARYLPAAPPRRTLGAREAVHRAGDGHDRTVGGLSRFGDGRRRQRGKRRTCYYGRRLAGGPW